MLFSFVIFLFFFLGAVIVAFVHYVRYPLDVHLKGADKEKMTEHKKSGGCSFCSLVDILGTQYTKPRAF